VSALGRHEKTMRGLRPGSRSTTPRDYLAALVSVFARVLTSLLVVVSARKSFFFAPLRRSSKTPFPTLDATARPDSVGFDPPGGGAQQAYAAPSASQFSAIDLETAG